MNDPGSVAGRSALLLDLDGTLYPTEDNGAYLDEVQRITGKRVAEIYDTDDPREAYVRLQADRESNGFPSDTTTLATLYGIQMREMNRFRERWSRPEDFLAPDPRATDAIERMLASRILVLGTNNTPVLARRILRILQIPDAWFAAILASEDLGAAKPDVAFFAAVCARSGIPALRFVSVGDRTNSDLAPAAAIGMGTWLVSRVEDLEALADACDKHRN